MWQNCEYTSCFPCSRFSAALPVCWMSSHLCFSEITPEGRRITKLDQILLNGNNITMVCKYPACLAPLYSPYRLTGESYTSTWPFTVQFIFIFSFFAAHTWRRRSWSMRIVTECGDCFVLPFPMLCSLVDYDVIVVIGLPSLSWGGKIFL